MSSWRRRGVVTGKMKWSRHLMLSPCSSSSFVFLACPDTTTCMPPRFHRLSSSCLSGQSSRLFCLVFDLSHVKLTSQGWSQLVLRFHRMIADASVGRAPVLLNRAYCLVQICGWGYMWKRTLLRRTILVMTVG